MVLSVTQQLPIARTFFPIAFGLALGGAIYVLVDAPPRELRRPGGCAFRGCLPNLLLYHRRAQAVGKAAALGLLFMVTGVANQQSYNFLSVANLAVVFPLVFAVLAVATHFPVSFRAEHVFLRLLGRFFRAYAYLASTLPWEPANPPTRWRLGDLARVPGKLAIWASALPAAALGDPRPSRCRPLVDNLQALAYRMQDLIETRATPQSQVLARELLSQVRAWRVGLQPPVTVQDCSA